MIRKLLARLLRADLEPQVAWSEAETMSSVASLTVEVPRLGSRTEKLEQVLCASGDRYVLFKRWSTSRQLMRLTFGRRLNAREMIHQKQQRTSQIVVENCQTETRILTEVASCVQSRYKLHPQVQRQT